MKVRWLTFEILWSETLAKKLQAAYQEGFEQGRREKAYIGNRQLASLLRDNYRLAGLSQPNNSEVRK